MNHIARALSDVEAAKKALRAVEGAQIQSRVLCEMLHALAELYFKELRGNLPTDSDTDAVFSAARAVEEKTVEAEVHRRASRRQASPH